MRLFLLIVNVAVWFETCSTEVKKPALLLPGIILPRRLHYKVVIPHTRGQPYRKVSDTLPVIVNRLKL